MESRALPSVEVRHYPDRILTDRHDYHQLLVGLDGCLELETGGHTVRVEQGLLAPVAAGDTHHYLSPGENRVLVLDLPVAWCETLELEAALLHPGRRLPSALVARAGSLAADDTAPRVAEWLTAALAAPGQRHSAPRLRLMHLLPAIRATLDRPWRVSEMAGHCHLAEAAFARQFRALTGVSPHVWLIRERLGYARRLMREPQASLTEIALASGFADAPHFSRTFRHRYGCSPRQWRAAFVSDHRRDGV